MIKTNQQKLQIFMGNIANMIGSLNPVLFFQTVQQIKSSNLFSSKFMNLVKLRSSQAHKMISVIKISIWKL